MDEQPEQVYRSEVPDSEETEFLVAVDLYKRRERRPFPTWREVLAIVRSLGYRKVMERGPLPQFKAGLKNHSSRSWKLARTCRPGRRCSRSPRPSA